MPSDERDLNRASDRKHERAESVENILEETESLVRDEQKFPVRSEELAEEYGDHPIDMPNETESLGSVFDRLEDEEEYDNAEEVREAVYGAVTGESGGTEEYNEERDLGAVDRAEGGSARNDVDGETIMDDVAADDDTERRDLPEER
ncbi:hypothetical protein NDI76_03780 [Halogeometricum sp. S1BR25-6]|uniref:DUF2795 domain-containing protein n=1 Tax=Halogeometricum salsisoli TaxID=2950536 RepID=A0ABU2GAL7_9EURY|nr:hypothetical protein [Halogeometricum sp. S1BR25-6]MDS0297851.1 hypothetical protein [Halogeometricum sp. S1BR25-6]